MKPAGYLLNTPKGLVGELGVYYDYVLASNGLFIRAQNSRLQATINIVLAEVRGLLPLEKSIELPGGKVKVSDVVHNRKVIFLRKEGLWIVIDELKSKGEHTYSQIWNFAHHYKEGEVEADDDLRRRRIVTRAPNGPNVVLYQFGDRKLTYEKFYGRKKPTRQSRRPSRPIPAVRMPGNCSHGVGATRATVTAQSRP